MNDFEISLKNYSKTEVHNTLFEACAMYKNFWKMLMLDHTYGITFYCDGIDNLLCGCCPFYLIKEEFVKRLENVLLYGEHKEDENGIS